jgi:hypothetical protein
MILSPLEQFEIISILPIQIFCFDFSVTNSLLISLLTLVFFSNMIYFFSSNENYLKKVLFFFIPNNWQMLIETLYEVVSKLVFDNVSLESEKYFPYTAVLFTFILFSLVPYSFTVTSHLIVTFALSFSTFIGIDIIGFQRHKLDMLSLIIPANTSFGLDTQVPIKNTRVVRRFSSSEKNTPTGTVKNDFTEQTAAKLTNSKMTDESSQSILIKEYFSKQKYVKLYKMVREAKIRVSNKDRNLATFVSVLTKKCLEEPALLDKFNIDLYKHRVIKQLPIAIDPETTTLVSVTKDSYFCLEDIFSVQCWDLKKTTCREWQRTQAYKDYLDAVSIRTKIFKNDLIVQVQIGRTYAHRLIAIEAARYRSPSLAVAFNEMLLNECFSKTAIPIKQEYSDAVLSETQIKAHPLYKMLVAENENLKQSNTSVDKPFYKFGKEKPTNYAVYFPASNNYKQGECVNIDKTLSTFRRVDINVKVVALVYHNVVSNDRFEFEKCISRKFSNYHIGNEQYGQGLNSLTIQLIWEEIIHGAGFDVMWESELEIDKYNKKK